MIHIDISNFRPPKAWRRKAKEHLKKIIKLQNSGNIVDRNTYIENHACWSEIKNLIIAVGLNKCWFSEGTSDVAHLHIEHFRPKKKVKLLNPIHNCAEARAIETSECYYWLAFNFRNYRICGQLVNSYKGNHFPLRPGSFIANNRADDFRLEEPILLDPTVPGDVDLISYDIDGLPYATANPITHPYEYLRAEVSIKLFGLKDSLIIEARKRKLQDLNANIAKIDRWYKLLEADPKNDTLLGVVKEECSYLIAQANRTQPFSRMVSVRIRLIPYQWATDFVVPYLN